MAEEKIRSQSSQWPVVFTGCVLSSFLSAVVAWFAAQSSGAMNMSALTSQLTAQVVALQAQQTDLKNNLKTIQDNMGIRFVSQDTFTEFKREYDAKAAESHDFQVRIDGKLDELLIAPGKHR